MSDTSTAALVLENGAIFRGRSIGAREGAGGEVCFNTSMSGYQEILTDPSYCGQIITMTHPMIGNVGVNAEDVESRRPWASGFVMREYSARSSNYRAQGTLGEYLAANGIPAIDGIDTRRLTRVLRSEGAMRGYLTGEELGDEELRARVAAVPDISSADLAARVSTPETYTWTETARWDYGTPAAARRYRVAVLDYGVKHNILRRLATFGCDLTVFPSTADAAAVLAAEPDGIFLSNGPGDPGSVAQAVDTIKGLLGRAPIFGICLGHQLLALAFGARTYKLKFGHRGANHPVMFLRDRSIEITSQNHGFAVDAATLPSDLELTHLNLNDNTVEGFRHRDLLVFCVQYHPEASPGPHDSDYLFREFCGLMDAAAG
ncbi:MAG: glutamine-hydrolyzing carbamoyl-phosphate synthase small subunit [Ignavibacteriae bacterium]|nr:glutamine-hydrolyzing carbamoyl-phosphate synthase small subunit [Ignavibacteriota bacterium]